LDGQIKGCLSNKTTLVMTFKFAQAAVKIWRRLNGIEGLKSPMVSKPRSSRPRFEPPSPWTILPRTGRQHPK
jgi:hypothetical protein